jgi:hypothetical protein
LLAGVAFIAAGTAGAPGNDAQPSPRAAVALQPYRCPSGCARIH